MHERLAERDPIVRFEQYFLDKSVHRVLCRRIAAADEPYFFALGARKPVAGAVRVGPPRGGHAARGIADNHFGLRSLSVVGSDLKVNAEAQSEGIGKRERRFAFARRCVAADHYDVPCGVAAREGKRRLGCGRHCAVVPSADPAVAGGKAEHRGEHCRRKSGKTSFYFHHRIFGTAVITRMT